MRELRLVAYGQFLESYKSCTLGGMAAAFGVSPAFLDEELAEFIVQGRLPAKIDKVRAWVAAAAGNCFGVNADVHVNNHARLPCLNTQCHQNRILEL